PQHQLTDSTLFPYTTLFRSREGAAEAAAFIDPLRGDELQAFHRRQERGRLVERRLQHLGGRCLAQPAQGGAADVQAHLARAARGDRKSTRLNSSHLGISYAV